MVAPMSRHPPVELTHGRTRLPSTRAAQCTTTSEVSLPPATESTITPPHGGDDSPDIALDLISTSPKDVHMPVEQIDHLGWA